MSSFERGLFRQNAFFLQRTNCLSRNRHCDFLSIDHEGLLLKIRLEDSLSAAQRKADIIAVLLSFAGDFTSRCHITSYLLSIYPFYTTVFWSFGQESS